MLLPFQYRTAMTASALNILVVSDLDGTLLDAATYSFAAAAKALEAIETKGCPLVLASSKTRAEMEPIRYQLNHHGPFIVENGGAVFIPKGFFKFPLEGTVLHGPYQVVELGAPYPKLRSALKEIAQALPCRISGFGDMSIEEVSRRTGLCPAEAVLAKQREYDEPFVVEESPTPVNEIYRLAEARGLHCTQGGRFYHLHGNTDKGRAGRYVIECFRRQAAEHGAALQTIGVGDSLNDLPMLQAVDHPVLVQRPDGSYDANVRLPNLIRAPGIGPAGWNEAILTLLSASQ
ncbi:MAG: HAD-IIB family hydrolase [Nitrospiraceae bacterium]